MTKYYRVIKDTPLWETGAIIKYDSALGATGGYSPVEDIWDRFDQKKVGWYEGREAVETIENKDFFERVYKSEGEKMVFKTASQLKKVYNSFISDTEEKKS